MTTPARALRRVLAVAVAAAISIGSASMPAAAQGEPVPPPDPDDVERLDLLVVDAPGRALGSGGSLTPFTVELEGEDECPGDSAHDQFRVDSYMVPIDVEPTELYFTGFGPTPLRFRSYSDFQMPLHRTTGDGYAAEITGTQIEPGGPGPIGDIPPFDFAVFVPTPGIDSWDGGVPAGAYRIGVACTFAGRITNLWETTIEVTADPADEPVGMTWTVTGPQPRELETAPSEPTALVVGLIALAVAMAVVAFLLHRSSRRRAEPTPVAVREESVV